MPSQININKIKVAVVHDWLVTYAGAERVLEQILICFPNSELFSLVDFLPDNERNFIKNKFVNTSFIQKLPFARSNYRSYLSLMPIAIEQFDLSKFDLIISSSHAVAKGVITGPDQLHICMCYSPIRYAWDLQHQYLNESNLKSGFRAWAARFILHKIRIWDYRTSNSVDHFISISKFISRRINKTYGRSSTVIYPPVDILSYTYQEIKSDFYLTASRMVPYKKIAMIVEAFSKMPDKKLIVIGDGPDFKKCKTLAGSNVLLMGWQPFDVLKYHMQFAKAFVFAAEEDFGIAPLEAQACGTPVIAYSKGAVGETIRGLNHPNPTGVLFDAQTPEDLIAAVNLFEISSSVLNAHECRDNAIRFSTERFNNEFTDFIESRFNTFIKNLKI